MRSDISGQVIGELINLSGRQRMLSQRAILHVLLARDGDAAALAIARDCIATFAATHGDLVTGNERLPGVFSDALQQLYFGASRADDRIRRFVALAERALAALEAGTGDAEPVDALVAHATPLLELLQQITLAYQHEMRGIEAAAQKRQAAIADHLASISMQANIVALNARISAARAGQYGREFAVITTVLADIIREMDQLIQIVVVDGERGAAANAARPASIRPRPGAPARPALHGAR